MMEGIRKAWHVLKPSSRHKYVDNRSPAKVFEPAQPRHKFLPQFKGCYSFVDFVHLFKKEGTANVLRPSPDSAIMDPVWGEVQVTASSWLVNEWASADASRGVGRFTILVSASHCPAPTRAAPQLQLGPRFATFATTNTSSLLLISVLCAGVPPT